MISAHSAAFLIQFIALLMAYLICAPLAGAFRAWIASKLGDDTGRSLGYMTLNPFAHIDFLAIGALYLFGFVWTRTVPINPYAFSGRGRWVKLFIAYFSDVFMYFALATVALFGLIWAFGPSCTHWVTTMIQYSLINHKVVTHYLQGSSSFTIALAFVAIVCIYLNIILAVISLIIGAFTLLFMNIFERYPHLYSYSELLFFAVPFICIFLFSYYIHALIVQCVMGMGDVLIYVLHYIK